MPSFQPAPPPKTRVHSQSEPTRQENQAAFAPAASWCASRSLCYPGHAKHVVQHRQHRQLRQSTLAVSVRKRARGQGPAEERVPVSCVGSVPTAASGGLSRPRGDGDAGDRPAIGDSGVKIENPLKESDHTTDSFPAYFTEQSPEQASLSDAIWWDEGDDEEPLIPVGNQVADDILRSAGYNVKSLSKANANDEENEFDPLANPVNDKNSEEQEGTDHRCSVDVQTQLSFERKGHCALPNLLGLSQVEPLTRAINEKFENSLMDAYRQKLEVLWGEERANDTLAEARTPRGVQKIIDEAGVQLPFLQLFNLHETVPEVDAIVRDPILGHIAADLLGINSVRLYQDSVFWKRPGDGPTPYHADLSMMPVDTNSVVTFFVPLRALPGGKYAPSLRFASGSHRDLSLLYWYNSIGAAGKAALIERGREAVAPPKAVSDLSTRYKEESHGPMKLGSATAHHGFTLHCSPGIPPESRGRMALSICYIAADARVLPKPQQRLVDSEDSWSHRRWLKQSKAGKPIKTPLLPIVFERTNNNTSL